MKRALPTATKVPSIARSKRTTKLPTKKPKHSQGVPIQTPKEGTPEPHEPIRTGQHTPVVTPEPDSTGIPYPVEKMTNITPSLPDWASAIQKQVDKHEELYTLITQQQAQLAKQQEQLEEQQRFSREQQRLLTELMETIRTLRDTVKELQLPRPPSTVPPPPVATPAPSHEVSPEYPPLQGTAASHWASGRKTAPSVFKRSADASKPIKAPARRPPPSRVFSAPPTVRSEYAVTYLQVRHRYTQSELRKSLRDLKINSARIIDITLPAAGVVGLLTHSSFQATLKTTLEAAKIKILDFDPQHPTAIGDPKLKELTEEQKARIARHLHNANCLRGLAGMPAHIRRSVAHDYFVKGYITDQQYDYHIGKATREQVSDAMNPITVAKLIESFAQDDSEMGSTSPATSPSASTKTNSS